MKRTRQRTRASLTAAAIIATTLTAAPAQADVEPLATDGVYYISPKHAPTKCITVHGGSSAPGAIVNQYRCMGREHQKWNLTNGEAGVTLVNRYTGLCMVVWQRSTARGARISQDVCNSGPPAQRLFLVIGFESTMKTFTAPNMCVGVGGGSTLDGAAIIQWTCDGSLNQRWTFKRV